MDIERFVAQIEANIRNFERNMNRAIAKSTQLPDEVTTDVDADISKFRRGLLRATALAQRFSAKDIVKRIRLSVINPARAYHSIKTNFTDPFNRRMGELAENIRTFGTVFGNMIKGSLIASITAVVPIIAGFTSAIMALGNSIGVVTGNLLGFIGALGVAGLGAAAYGGLVASVLARYNDEAFEATEASSAFTRSLDSIKSAWNGIVDQNIDRIFMQMGQAIYGAQFALEGLTPFINDVVESMTGMTNKFKDFMKESPTMLRFYDNMSEKGSTVFESVINGLGQFGKGLVDMVNAGMPLIESVAGAFENMGTKFANWSERMAENDGFKAFTEYVNENMPKISSIFGNAFHGIIDLFAAFGENSSLVLDGLVDMMERFREWSATIKESDGFQKFIDYIQTNGPTVVSLIGNIVMMVVNLAIALAPLAEKVLEVVNAIVEWISKLFETNPAVGMVVGAITTLFGIFMMLMPAIIAVTTFLQPLISGLFRLLTSSTMVNGIMWVLRGAMVLLSGAVGVVIGVLTALVAIFVMLYQEVEWFRNVVNSVWTFVTTFIQERVALIIETFNQFREQGQGIFEALWNTIVTIISEGLAQTWTSITTWISEILVAFLEWGSRLIESIRTTLAEFAVTILTKLLEAKERFTTWISETIAAIIQFGADLVSNIISALSEFASNIASKLSEAYNNFTSWVSDTISSIVSFGAELVSSIISSMAEFVSGIVSGTADALAEFASFAAEGVSEIISFGADMVSEIISAMADFVSEIISGGANAVSEVATMGGNIVSEIGGFVGDMVSAGADLIQGLIDGIMNMASSAVEAAKGVVGDAIAGAKSLLGINSPSKVFRDIGQYTSQGLAIGINKDANKAVESVTRMANDMTNAFVPELSGINAGMDAELSTLNKDIRNTIDADITSGIETQRPIVNVTVRNEGDVEMIRSYIQEEDGIDESLAF